MCKRTGRYKIRNYELLVKDISVNLKIKERTLIEQQAQQVN